VYKNDDGIVQAMRNLSGVTLLPVDKLNLLKLAPGGHVGRFTIYTQAAFEALDQVLSKNNKKGFSMPRSIVSNPDLQRILKADEVKSALKWKGKATKRSTVKKNPLKNIKAMLKLNPFAAVQKRAGWKLANKASDASRNEEDEKMEVTIVEKQHFEASPAEKSGSTSEKSDEKMEDNEIDLAKNPESKHENADSSSFSDKEDLPEKAIELENVSVEKSEPEIVESDEDNDAHFIDETELECVDDPQTAVESSVRC